MSNRIDQRIVEMSFENSKFEKGILQSRNSLKDFSKALDQTSTTKDFSSLEHSLEVISKSFTSMGQVGVGVLREIGANAVRTGNALFKSLAIDPITSGFGEMELKMNSTQTIMASTGESLAVVNQRLQELNEYSDQTIYSFSDMTSNIGKFTNAGVKLEDAVASIKGISNVAALSGANAEEASRAMYNFAQALSAGFVKLADWKSIELANMATVEFKQQLIDSAVAAGTLAKQANGMYKVLSKDASGSAMDGAISATKNFNESLSYQWMTTTALTKTLGKYADSTTDIGKRATLAATQVTTFSKLLDTLKESVGSGWAQTFELIFGDFDEARNLWSSMNRTLGQTIGELADARNELLSGGLSSGWKQFMQEGISDTEAFGLSLREVAKTSGIDIEGMIQKTGSLEAALKGNWLTGDMLTATVSKMAASIENMSDAELQNTKYTTQAKTELLALRDALLSGRISAEEFAKKMSGMSGRENIIQGLKNSVVALLTAVRPISKAFDQIFPPMTVKTLYEMTENFKNLTAKLIISEETADRIRRSFAGVFAVFDIGWRTVKFLGSAVLEIAKAILPVNSGFLEVTATLGDFLVIVNKLIQQSGVFEYGLIGIKIAAVIVRNTISTMTGAFVGFVRTLLSVEHPLQYLGEVIQSIFSNIFSGMSEGVRWISTKFIGSLNSLQKFFTEKLNLGDGSTVTSILNSLKEFLAYVVDGGADGIVSLSDALNSLDFSRIATFVTGGILLVFINQLTRLTKVTGDLVETSNSLLSKFSKKLFAPVTQLKDFAFAVGVLSASLYVLSTIPFERLKLGLAGLAAGMVIFTATYAAMQAITVIGTKQLNGAEAMKSALNLTAIAGGLAILAIAVSKVSQIDRGDVWNSVAVVGAMMGIITAYQALTVAISLIPGTRAANIGMGLMASGLLGLITIVLLMHTIQPEMITDSLSKLSGAMLMLAGIQALFAVASRASGGNKVAINVFGIAGGLLALVGVVKLIGILDPNEIMTGAKNVLLLGTILAAIQAMFGLASLITGGVKFKTNILSMQLGIASMAIMASVIGRMDQKTLQNGIVNITKMAGIIGALELVTALSARLGKGQPLQKILGSITMTMVAFAGLIAVLGNYEQATIDRGFATITKLTGLIMGIELMTAIIGSIRGSKSGAGMLIGMTLTILTLTASLSLLAMIDQEALTQASTSLTKVIAAVGIMGIGLGILSQSLSGMNSGFGLLKGMVNTIIPGFVALFAVLGATLVFLGAVNMFAPMMQSLDWSIFSKFIAGMGAITVLIGAFTILSSIPGLGSGMQNLKGLIPGLIAVGTLVVATAGLFAVISTVLPTIDDMSWSSFGKLIIGLSFIGIMVAGITALTPALIALGAGSKLAFAGVVTAIQGIGIVVAAFTVLATVMGLLFSGGGTNFLISGIDQLIIVAGGIGRFIGAIVGGFNSQVLVGFGDGMAKFANAVSMIKPESFGGVESLAKAMLALTGASLLDGLARFVGFGSTPVDVFGEQITGLINSFKKLDPAAVTNFANTMLTLHPALGSFSELITTAETIPNSGGVAWILAGDNSIDQFGGQIARLINSFVSVPLDNVQTTTSKMMAAVPMLSAVKEFITVAKTIPNSGGVAWIFAGDNNIDQFGLKMAGLVNSFVPIPMTNVESTTSKLSLLSTMTERLKDFIVDSNNIPANGDLLSGLLGNNSINAFGERLRGFIETLYAIDNTKLTSAMDNLTQINNSIKVVGTTAIATAVTALDNKKQSLADGFTGVFNTVLNQSKTYVKEFETFGLNVIQGLQNGIIDGQKDAVKAAEAVATAVITATRTRLDINSPSKVFTEIGTWLPVGLGNGIKKNSKVAILASANMGGEVEEAIRNSLGVHSESQVFKDIAAWVPQSMSNGIDSTKAQLLETAKSLGVDVSNITTNSLASGFKNQEGVVTTGLNSLLDMLSGKQTFAAVAGQMGVASGGAFTDGMTSGIESGGSKVKSAAAKLGQDAFSKLKEEINKRKEFNLITIDEEIDAWDKFSKLYKAGTEMRMKADNELGRVRYEKSRTWIEKEKYYKRLSLEEELKAWETVQSRYKANHEYRLQAEREIFRIKEEMWQAEYQSKLEAIDDAKYYGQMNLQQELDAQKQIREMTKDSSDERKKSDKEIYRLEKDIRETNLSYEQKLKQVETDRFDARKRATDEYYQHEKEINEQLQRDVESLRKSYEDALDSRTKTLYSSYGLFDKVEGPEAVDGLVLTQNLENQTKSFESWQNNIGSLVAKGVDQGLIKELREMGPKANAQLIALNSLSSDELSKYVSLWQTKSQQARSQATLELQALKVSTETEITAITEVASEKLQVYSALWNEAMTTIDTNTKAQLDSISKEWTTSVGTMTKKGVELIKKFSLDWYGEVNTVINTTKNEFLNLQAFMDNFKFMVPSLSGGDNRNTANLAGIGNNIITGIATGMTSKAGLLTATAVGISKGVNRATNDYWQIHSPSKRTTETGMYIVMGLAEGLQKFAQIPITMAEGLGGKVVDAMSTSMSSIPELFDNGVDEITITPVVDLSNVKTGVRDVNNMFDSISGLDLSTTMGLLPTAIQPTAKLAEVDKTSQKQSSTPQTIQFTQNNYSPKALSRLDIYRQTRNQISTMKGVVMP